MSRNGEPNRDNTSAALKHQNTNACVLGRKALPLDNSLPVSDIIQWLQKLTHIVYLAKLDAGDKVKVQNYLTDAEAELACLKNFVAALTPLQSPQQVN